MNTNEVIERRKVAPVLLDMQVGTTELFPVEQLDSINTTIQRLQTRHYNNGFKWSAYKKFQGEQLFIEVSRKA